MDKMIVYEDDVLLVVHKPSGIATETSRIGQADIVSELKNYRKKKGEDTYIGVIHRLDQPVEGLLVFAKNQTAAKKLTNELQTGVLSKKYTALVAGVPAEPEGDLSNYLSKDARTNLSSVVTKDTKGAKEAQLHWKLLQRYDSDDSDAYSMVEIELFTGRHHQIRVQMAHAGFPLLGDVKYGSEQSKRLSEQVGVGNTALIADKLNFRHPQSGKKMEFTISNNFLKT